MVNDPVPQKNIPIQIVDNIPPVIEKQDPILAANPKQNHFRDEKTEDKKEEVKLEIKKEDVKPDIKKVDEDKAFLKEVEKESEEKDAKKDQPWEYPRVRPVDFDCKKDSQCDAECDVCCNLPYDKITGESKYVSDESLYSIKIYIFRNPTEASSVHQSGKMEWWQQVAQCSSQG